MNTPSPPVPPEGPAGGPYPGAPGNPPTPPYGGPTPGYPAPGYPAPGAPPPYGAASYPYPLARPNHPQAVTALVLGIVGLVACGLVGIPAYVIGRKAQREIDANPTIYDGRSLAMAGWILGAVAIGLMVLSVVVIVVVVVIGAAASST